MTKKSVEGMSKFLSSAKKEQMFQQQITVAFVITAATRYEIGRICSMHGTGKKYRTT
jgi:ferritin